MDTKDNDIKFTALEGSVYCPPFKEENAIAHLILDGEFDVEKAKVGIRESVDLLSYQRSYRPLILEILDILDQNRAHFLVDKQNHITFYWSGILVLRIDINRDVAVEHKKQLHVSLQKYKVEKSRLLAERKANNLVFLGMGGTAVVSGLLAGCMLYNKLPSWGFWRN